MAGEGFQMGFQLGSALAKGVAEWRSIQLDRQQRQRFDGYMSLAAQRRAMIRSAANVEEAAMLEQLKSQIQRYPNAEQADRPTGNVSADGKPETEQVIRTPEGDIPIQQLLMLKQRKAQAETTAEIAEVDLIMEIQARDPDNPYVKQWVASTYAGIQQKQQIRARQVEAQRLQLDTIGAGLERERFDEQSRLARERLGFEKQQYGEAPGREQAKETFQTNERIRGDAARIEAQKRADLEVEGVKAQNKPEKAPTELQTKLRQLAPRAQEALDALDSLGYDRTGVGAAVDTVTPDAFKPGERQQLEQAQLQFVNSVLRAESGATITPDEIQKAVRQYFPQVGESPEVVAQKRKARETAARGLFEAAGLAAPARGVGAPPADDGSGTITPEQARAELERRRAARAR